MAGDITTIARPYAEAAFAAGRESKEIEAWSEALDLLGTIAANSELASQIGNPNVPRERLRDMILAIAGDSLPSQARNLVKLLADNGRLAVLPEIARLFEILRTEQRGVRQVHIRSAFEMDEDAQAELTAALKARLGADIELTVETDSSLIGGVEIRADDLVIDGSVRGGLHKLATELQI
jgi:F-type H+-transporting ATPase subunit delta